VVDEVSSFSWCLKQIFDPKRSFWLQ
jgi:hypothetical protein